jgi:serine/threonine protein phosphatase PrpC
MRRIRFLSERDTHEGHARRTNEDAVHADDHLGVYFVVDGMGGQAAGEQAARIAHDTLKGRLERTSGSAERRIKEAIALANNAIFEAAERRQEWKGMGCVLTVAVVEEGKAWYGHVGDTRMYKIRRGRIDKITRDHSPVGELEDADPPKISEEEAMNHPRRNEVYRDAGSKLRDPDEAFFIDSGHVVLEPDAALLLCSDGLTDVVPKARILEIIEECAGNPKSVTAQLTAAANEVGKDNVSVVYVEGEEFAPSLGRSSWSVAPRLGLPFDRSHGSDTTEAVQLPNLSTDRKTLPSSESVRQRKALLPVIALVFLAGFALGGGADRYFQQRSAPRIIEVGPGGHSSISLALEHARPGDTVRVAPGDYREVLRLRQGVHVQAASPGPVALYGPNNPVESAVLASGITGGKLSGFQIRAEDGRGFGRGVLLKDAEVELERLEISGALISAVEYSGRSGGGLSSSYFHGNAGVAVEIGGESAPRIAQNLFLPASGPAGEPRAHIQVQSGAKPVIYRNSFFSPGGGESIHAAGVPDPLWESQNLFAVKKADRPVSIRLPAQDRPRQEGKR